MREAGVAAEPAVLLAGVGSGTGDGSADADSDSRGLTEGVSSDMSASRPSRDCGADEWCGVALLGGVGAIAGEATRLTSPGAGLVAVEVVSDIGAGAVEEDALAGFTTEREVVLLGIATPAPAVADDDDDDKEEEVNDDDDAGCRNDISGDDSTDVI
jgi:hypothetical protein